MINTLISAVQQLFIFSLIPFLVYIIRYKKIKGFFGYIGLKPSNSKANGLALLLMALLALPTLTFAQLNADFRAALHDPSTVTGSIRQLGFGVEGVLTILVMAIIKTALTEEIFFRGFVAKRLIAISNFKLGNIIQAILFGAIHFVFFLMITSDPFFLTIILIVPTVGAYFKTIINEKVANGSIIPGWIAHASANLVSYTTLAYIL